MEPKVIIADDHSIVRMGLGSLIKQLGVNVVDEVSNCAELMSQLNNQTYSHLILDLIMPDGNALEIIPTLNKKYDLVFIDADKENYINYFHLIVPMMNKGGIILSDNVLWSGKVLEEVKANDIPTQILLEYNQLLKDDSRVETVLLPIRDGLMVSRVK